MPKKNNQYLINDKPVPSVTTILDVINKPELMDWYRREGFFKADRIKEAAADFGDKVHTAIEAIMSEKQTPYYDELRLKVAVDNFKVWADSNIEEWICFEKAVFHDELLYAGTIDAIARLKSGKILLCDYKSSKKVRPEYYLQVCAYINATRIEDNIINLSELEGAIIIHLDHASLTWGAVNVIINEDTFNVFKAALTLYNWRVKNAK